MNRIYAPIIALGIGLGVLPALAQVSAENTTPQGDGEARAGRCSLTQAAIGVVGTDDTQGTAHVKCSAASNTRIAHLYQVEIMNDGTRRIFQDTQFDWGGNKSPNKDLATDINTSCGPGSGQYALDMMIDSPKDHDLELGVPVTLPVSGCN